MADQSALREYFREPIPELQLAADFLNDAVSAHLEGRSDDAREMIRAADMPAISAWLESVWGAKSPYTLFRPIADPPPYLPKALRATTRMPSPAEKRNLLLRDGYHCRFCSIPLIRAEIRTRIGKVYPTELRWAAGNRNQHAAFQAMWVQYDHIVPHARGGTNDEENMVVTCAACNYGRMEYLLSEVGISDPRQREPNRSEWDGLERFAHSSSTKR